MRLSHSVRRTQRHIIASTAHSCPLSLLISLHHTCRCHCCHHLLHCVPSCTVPCAVRFAMPCCAQGLLLTSSRSDVKLWDGQHMERGAVQTWDGVCRARFNSTGTHVVAVTSTSPRQAVIYDVRSGAQVWVCVCEGRELRGRPPRRHDDDALPWLGSVGRWPPPLTAGDCPGCCCCMLVRPSKARSPMASWYSCAWSSGHVLQAPRLPDHALAACLLPLPAAPPHAPPSPGAHLQAALLADAQQLTSPGSELHPPGRGRAALLNACFHPSKELVLWGSSLWDPRAPRMVHQFDQLTEGGSGAFHPSGEHCHCHCLAMLWAQLDQLRAPCTAYKSMLKR